MLFFKNYADSTLSIALNAQQEPHSSWFLTGVNAFLFLQSTGDDDLIDNSWFLKDVFFFGISTYFKYIALNSLNVKSENLFNPNLYLIRLLSYNKLFFMIISFFSLKIFYLRSCSCLSFYDTPCTFFHISHNWSDFTYIAIMNIINANDLMFKY